MEPAKRKSLKEQLLRDIERWNHSDPRGFRDIVRNAADIDKKILYGVMKAFQASREDVRAWGSGAEVPEDFKRHVIVEKIRELLEEDLNA